MKSILYILSFNMLFLSCFPCAEGECRDNEGIAAVALESDEHSDEEDACSPFCNESCCSLNVICQPTYQVLLQQFYNGVASTQHYESTPSLLLYSIWQTEDRIGGDIKFIEGEGNATNTYFEENNSQRFSTQFSLSHKINEKSSLNVKNSVNHFDRTVEIPGAVALIKRTTVGATATAKDQLRTKYKRLWI